MTSQRASEAQVNACMRHLTNNAQRYYDMVTDKDADGILWAVFQLAGHQPNTTAVNVKRSSFLPLSQMMSTKAQSLVQMYHSCDLSSQFVCWFTLENSRGEPLVSKVMIVEAPSGSGANPKTPDARRPGTAATATPGLHPPNVSAIKPAAAETSVNAPQLAGSHEPRPPNRNDTTLESLKEDMMNFQRQEAQGSSAAHHGSRGGAMGSTTPRGGHTHQRATSPGLNPTAPSSAETDKQYQHVLRVSLQIADSVAKMGTAMDTMSRRIDELESKFNEAPKAPPPELIAKLLGRIEEVETRNSELEKRVSAFDMFQENIFSQFEQFKAQVSGGGGGYGGSQRSADWGAQSMQTPALSKSVLDTPVTSRLMDQSAANTSRLQAAPSAASNAALPAPEPASTTPTGSVRGALFSAVHTGAPVGSTAPPSESSTGAGLGAANADGSLSDMIKTMEAKLSKIRAPA